MLSLAFYLPQFHPIPENDRWWGEGFTEWTKLRSARTWYPGHRIRQPIEPLGHYHLLDPAVIEAQQALAEAHGIDGFLIWDYWFGEGRRLLDAPLAMILERRLKVRYALAWANHDWTQNFQRTMLMKQRYLGVADYRRYFLQCLPHFRSDRYLHHRGRLLFYVYRPADMPDFPDFAACWQSLAREHALPAFHFVGDQLSRRQPRPVGLDAFTNGFGFWTNRKKLVLNFVKEKLRTKLRIQTSPQRFRFDALLRGSIPPGAPREEVPVVITGWDTTPRHGRNGVIVDGLTPASFRRHLDEVERHLARQAPEDRLVLVKSWNEWAEGNLLEPDSVHGHALLEEYRGFARRAAALPPPDGSTRPTV